MIKTQKYCDDFLCHNLSYPRENTCQKYHPTRKHSVTWKNYHNSFYCVRSNHLLLCGYREKKRRKHLNLGYGNCFVIGLTLQMLLFSTKSSQRHFFEENSLAYNICACLATLFLGWHFLTLIIFHLPLSRSFIWAINCYKNVLPGI